MTAKRRLLLIGIPALAGLALLLIAALLRRAPESDAPAARKPRGGSPGLRASPEPSPEIVLTPAPPEQIAVAVENSRVRGTYSNYRTAVATGNTVLEESLRKILARDRRTALALAEEDLRGASTSMDREIAQKTLESLRK